MMILARLCRDEAGLLLKRGCIFCSSEAANNVIM